MTTTSLPDQLTDRAEGLGTSVSTAFDGLRDRTADLVRADGGSVFRELHRLGSRIDDADDRSAERLEAAVGLLEDRLDELAKASRRTSWPRRLLWFFLGVGIGGTAAYLGDPEQGRARRAQALEQTRAALPIGDDDASEFPLEPGTPAPAP